MGMHAVADSSGWHHIDDQGLRAYMGIGIGGNFQQHRSTVRDKDGAYFHIRVDGSILDGGPYSYAGDFREGAAVVRGLDGLCRHVDLEGQLVNKKNSLILTIFTKGMPELEMNVVGSLSIVMERNDSWQTLCRIEPFYNGQAHVRTHAGNRLILSEEEFQWPNHNVQFAGWMRIYKI